MDELMEAWGEKTLPPRASQAEKKWHALNQVKAISGRASLYAGRSSGSEYPLPPGCRTEEEEEDSSMTEQERAERKNKKLVDLVQGCDSGIFECDCCPKKFPQPDCLAPFVFDPHEGHLVIYQAPKDRPGLGHVNGAEVTVEGEGATGTLTLSGEIKGSLPAQVRDGKKQANAYEHFFDRDHRELKMLCYMCTC